MKDFENDKLSFGTKFFYGLGDSFGGGSTTLINLYFAIFLTDVVGLKIGYIGPILLIGRVWDAITDPLVGQISDNTRTRFGRRRPYFLLAGFLIAFSFILLWFPVQFPTQLRKFFYALVTYLLFTTIFTLAITPYNALGAELTLDYNERTSLTTFRMISSFSAAIIVGIIPMMIVNSYDNIRTGYVVMATIFGIAFSLPWFGIFSFTQEKIKPQKEKERINLKKTFTYPLSIKTFRKLIALFLLAYLSFDIISTLFAYYTKYVLKNEQALPLILGSMMISLIISIPLYGMLAKKTSKKTAYITGAIIWTCSSIFWLFFNESTPIFVPMIIAFVIGSGASAVSIMPFSMFGDVTDVAELKYGERKEGIFSGIMTFLRKATAGIALAIVTSTLALAGYVNPENGVVQTQPASFTIAVRVIISIVPIVLMLIAIVIAINFPLDRKNHKMLREYLNFTRDGQPVPDALTQEIEKIKTSLL